MNVQDTGGGVPGVYPIPRKPRQTSNIPRVVMQGGQPTMGAYGMHDYGQPLPAGTDPMVVAARQNQIHRQAVAYARARLAQMRAVAAALPPDLQQQLAGTQGANVDPAAAWRAISGAFAQTSRQAGYVDPRYYLLRVLPEIMRSRAAQAANPMQGGI
jgi:hypothetical protein